MAITQEQYYKLPTESIDQYNARIAGLRGEIPAIPSANAPITSASTAPTSPINVQTPQSTPIYSASSVPETSKPVSLEPTAEEKNISDIIGKITNVQNELTGQTIFTAEQQKAQGLEELTKTQNDLNAKLQLLKANEVNIPLQLQQQATGRGITAGGLAPLESGALRENAISANIIGAQLAGIQGKISTANMLVENAVRMKFGPKEEELKALTANLENLLKDPKLTIAEKNRALAQLEAQKVKEAQIAKDKDNYENAQKEILKYPNAPQSIRDEMSKQTTAVGVQAVAQKYGLKTQKELETGPKTIGSASTGYFQFNPMTGQYDISVGEGRNTEAGIFTSTQINSGAATAETSIEKFKNFDTDTKNFFINRGDEIKSKKKIIDTAKNDGADPNILYKEITDSNAPQPVKDLLTNYLKKSFPNIDITKEKLPWWKRLFGITQ